MKSPEKKNIYRFMLESPQVGARVYIDEKSSVSGSVVLGDDVSVWPMVAIRGDVNHIQIGARCNIQDGAVLHVTHESDWMPEGLPLILGDDVTVAHGAILHACTIKNRCLIGMGAIVMDGAVLQSDCMIAGGAIVTPGTRVPPRTLWRGNPARHARDLTDTEVQNLAYNARHYVRLKDLYLEKNR